jgi:hypothetical protein
MYRPLVQAVLCGQGKTRLQAVPHEKHNAGVCTAPAAMADAALVWIGLPSPVSFTKACTSLFVKTLLQRSTLQWHKRKQAVKQSDSAWIESQSLKKGLSVLRHRHRPTIGIVW